MMNAEVKPWHVRKHYIRDAKVGGRWYPQQMERPQRMGIYAVALFAALLAFLAIVKDAGAQTVPGSVTFTWKLPTQTVTGLPLTGADALTEVQAFIGTSPINTSATTPTLVLSPTATTTTYTLTVTNGATIYGRFKACNKTSAGALKCSDMSAQASKVVQVDTTPDVPTDVTITIVIAPAGG